MAVQPYKKPYYWDYIKTPEWREKATAAKRRAGWRCQVCYRHRSEVILDAHHRTYDRLGREWSTDLTVLCRDCHGLYEREKRLPPKPPKIPPPPPPKPPELTPSQSGSKRRFWIAGIVVAAVTSVFLLGYMGFFDPSSPVADPTDTTDQGAPGDKLSTSGLDVPDPLAAASDSTDMPLPRCTARVPAAVYSAPVYGDLTALVPDGRNVEIVAMTECADAVWYRTADNGWIHAEGVRCNDIDLTEVDCPGGAALAAEETNRCIVSSNANTRFGPSVEYDIDTQMTVGDEITVIGENNTCSGSLWYRVAGGRWLASTALHCPGGVDTALIQISCPALNWPENFGPMAFCTPDEFDIERGQCIVETSVFRGITPKLYASWTPSVHYVNAEFRKDWYIDNTKFLTSTSRNMFGYLEVATLESLRLGSFRVELMVGDELVQTGTFLIAE